MTPANPDALADALAEFQRRNGFHKREIEELLMDFGALVLAAAEARAAQLQAEVEALKEDGWMQKAASEIDKIADLWSGDGRAYAKTIVAILRAEADRTALAARAATAREGQADA